MEDWAGVGLDRDTILRPQDIEVESRHQGRHGGRRSLVPTDLQAVAAVTQVIGVMDRPGRKPKYFALQLGEQLELLVGDGGGCGRAGKSSRHQMLRGLNRRTQIASKATAQSIMSRPLGGKPQAGISPRGLKKFQVCLRHQVPPPCLLSRVVTSKLWQNLQTSVQVRDRCRTVTPPVQPASVHGLPRLWAPTPSSACGAIAARHGYATWSPRTGLASMTSSGRSSCARIRKGKRTSPRCQAFAVTASRRPWRPSGKRRTSGFLLSRSFRKWTMR